MKTKPIIFSIAGVLFLGACIFLFMKSKTLNEPDKNGITQFLERFNDAVKVGNTDTLMQYFEAGQQPQPEIKKFLGLLSGKTNSTGKSSAMFKPNLEIENSEIKILNPELAEVTIPVYFTYSGLDTRPSKVVFKIHEIAGDKFVISQFDATAFLADYIAYENYIKTNIIDEKEIYSPITLKAFEKAKILKSKYDSVIWFAHVNNETYFYVVNGEWDIYKSRTAEKKYRMGLLNPQLTEIIPAEYDLVHNINGTLKGLIEVEKDDKRGFYDLAGKMVIPVEYDQVFPVNNGDTIAAMRKGNDFYCLMQDFIIIDKLELEMGEILLKIPGIGGLNVAQPATDNITEVNSREEHASVYVPPSYLVDLNIFGRIQFFKNPLRKKVEFYNSSDQYKVSAETKTEDNGDNLFETAFYSIRDYFLGGRSEFYDRKNIIIVDKKRNRVFSHSITVNYEGEGTGMPDKCNENWFRPINDSLFEIKSSAVVAVNLPGKMNEFLQEAPVYHYLYVKDNKLEELNTKRLFAFTKFVKMDDSYINGCYVYSDTTWTKATKTNNLKRKYLQYIKNEIYADYGYRFKSDEWDEIFKYTNMSYKAENNNVDDSLTVIDRFNINWINQKLNQAKADKLASK